jgi:predicted ferric reductase
LFRNVGDVAIVKKLLQKLHAVSYVTNSVLKQMLINWYFAAVQSLLGLVSYTTSLGLTSGERYRTAVIINIDMIGISVLDISGYHLL